MKDVRREDVVVVFDILRRTALHVVEREIVNVEVACSAECLYGGVVGAVAGVLVIGMEWGGNLVWCGGAGRRLGGCCGRRGLDRIPRFGTRDGRVLRARPVLDIAPWCKV